MNEKRLTVIVYGCDRKIWRGGPLQLRISDIFASGGPRPLYKGGPSSRQSNCNCSCPSMRDRCTGLPFQLPTIVLHGSFFGGLISSAVKGRLRSMTSSCG